MKRLLTLGFLSGAAAQGAAEDQTQFEFQAEANTQSHMKLGSATIVKHTDKEGKFDVKCEPLSGGSCKSDQYDYPLSGFKMIIQDDTGDIKQGVTLQYSHISCDTASDTDFSNVLLEADVGSVAVFQGTSETFHGCLYFNNDGKHWGESKRTILFQDIKDTKYTVDGVIDQSATLQETWKFDLRNIGSKRVDSTVSGISGVVPIDNNGKVTVGIDVQMQIGADDDKFGDCQNYFNGTAPALKVEHRGQMITDFSSFHSDHKNGHYLSPTSPAPYQGGTTSDTVNGCQMRFHGNFDRQFEIDDMHTEYWDGACDTNLCNGALHLTYGSSTWSGAGIAFRADPTTATESSTLAPNSDAQDNVDLLPDGAAISLEDLFVITPKSKSYAGLMEEIHRDVLTDSSCSSVSPSVKLYSLSAAQLAEWHEEEEKKCQDEKEREAKRRKLKVKLTRSEK